MQASAGLLSIACHFPSLRRTIEDVCNEEGVELSPEVATSLGIDSVHDCETETSSSLALVAAREAVRCAELDALDINVIIDYSVLPQDYLVPSWSMGNKLQHELGATKAFTIGFSGGGSTSFQIALHAGVSLIQSDDRINTILLVGAECAIPANRVLNPSRPITVLGDGASAAVLQRDATRNVVMGTELISDGSFHDVCCIRGGGMAHPDRVDLYRMMVDEEKFARAPKMDVLSRLARTLLDRVGLDIVSISQFVYPNVSADDRTEFVQAFDIREEQACAEGLKEFGHVQATDLVLNYRTAIEAVRLSDGDYVLMCSHGMGHVSGVTLFKS